MIQSPLSRRFPSTMKDLLLFAVLLLTACGTPERSEQTYKNVIVMVPDGTGHSIVTLARWWKGSALSLDSDLKGAVRTYNSNSVITDSAAAATAFATGYKTAARSIAAGPAADHLLSSEEVPPESLHYKPLATVLEAAKLQGKATGLVATSSITHATPAAFAAHVQDRDMDNEIMEQLVYQDIDVVFGGGKRHLIPSAAGGKRTDGEDLLQVLRDRGYSFVETNTAMATANGSKVWGLFASNHMEADVDRDEFAPQQPSLAEMTAKAIELLAKNNNGFFLMVEASQVDWAAHDNDPYYRLTEFLAFEQAYAVARDFAKQEGNTLLIAFPDHNTGGMTIGRQNALVGYSATSIENLLKPLRKMHSTRTGVTSTGLDHMIKADMSNGLNEAEAIRKNLLEWWGIDAMAKDITEIIDLRNSKSLRRAVCEVIGRNHTVIGWTTHDHTGEDVPLWVYGINKPYGVINNIVIADIVADALSVSLAFANDELFIDAKQIFPEAILDVSDAANPVLRIGEAVLPISKDILEINGEIINLSGLVVYAPLAPTATPILADAKAGKVYIPRQAVDIINSHLPD